MEILLDGAVVGWGGLGVLGIPLHGYALKADDGTVVWVDPPPVPPRDEPAVFQLGQPSHIFVTFRDHDRAVAQYMARFNAKLWIPSGRGGSFDRPDVEFGEATDLPGGLRALSMVACGYGEHALLGTVRGRRFAFTGDSLWNFEGSCFNPLVRFLAFRTLPGGLALKRHYRGGDDSAAYAEIAKLADQDLDALLLSHGAPIERDARQRLALAFGRQLYFGS